MFEGLINFFSSFKRKSKKRRSPFVIVTVALLVIIPTVLAIFYGYFYEDTSFFSSNEIKLELYDKSNKLIYSEEINESSIASSQNANMLYSMHSEKQLSDKSIPEGKAPNFRFSVIHSDSTQKYDCYFNDSHASSLIKDSIGRVYSIPQDAYKAFMLSAFSESAYSSATPPALITGNGEKVSPRDAEWRYRRADGKFADAKKVLTNNSYSVYKIGGAINLSFEVVPNSCSVQIYDLNNDLIYDGACEELPFLTVKKGSTLIAHINAKWDESEERDFYGELSYDFKINVGDRSEFSLSATEVYPGQFAVISVTNVDDISKIIYSSKARRNTDFPAENERAFTELYQFVPTFVRDGEYVRAILPFPIGLPEYTFSFSISYGAAEQRFTVDILKAPEGSTVTLPNDTDRLNAITSTALQKELSALMKDLPASLNDIYPWKYEFASPLDFGYTPIYSCEDILATEDNEENKILSKGNGYASSVPEGNSVKALNVGRVIKISNSDIFGNYVVVDHGMGVRTWYCHLSDVDAIEGMLVTSSDSVGKSGSGALLSSNGVLILCSVNETLIDPDHIIGRKIEP